MGELFTCTAYHKSGYSNAMRSIQWQSFYASRGERHWLGDGVYFWQRYEDAVWWPGNYTDPVILVAELECEKDKFLDLDDPAVRLFFYSYMEKVFAELKKNRIDVHVNGKEKINSISCNYFKSFFHLDLIRYSFPDNSNRPQFCATESRVAKNIRRASETVTEYI